MRALLLAVVLAVAPAAPAHALPGDAPFEPLAPADGAAVPADPAGLPVAFTCPVYRIADPGFPVFGGARDYGVSLSASPALAGDGRLAEPLALVQGTQDGPDRCAAALGAGGAAPRPQETPGTYFWQVWRLCTGCAGSYEAGPVRRLVVRATATLTARPPARVYAGYPFILPVALDGVPDLTPFRVERRGAAPGRRLAPGPRPPGAASPPSCCPRPARRGSGPRRNSATSS